MKHIKKRIKFLAFVVFFIAFCNTAKTQNCQVSPLAQGLILPTFDGENPVAQTVNLSFTPSSCLTNINFSSQPGWITITMPTAHSIRVVCDVNTTTGARDTLWIFASNDAGFTIGTIRITQSVGCYKNWYPDNDGDTFGDFLAQPELSCTSPYTGWVNNNDDYCPQDSNSGNNGCPTGYVHENLNWITAKSFDINGNIKANSKAYFNELGKSLQTQSTDLKTGKTWSTQTLYDSQGRPALNTLSAPINTTGTFTYKSDFIQNSGNNTYDSSDFEANPENPSQVGTATNTLGWYFSTDNTDAFHEGNSYQDVTNRPYSRTLYSKLNPGTVLKTIGGKKIDGEWKQGYSFSMPASQELSQANAFNSTAYDSPNNHKIMKTVVRDVHGIENVVFTDTDGKTLAAARSGGSSARNMTISIGAQGFVDVHVPTGTTGFSVNSSAVTIFNLITETTTTASTTNLPNGFYRVAVTNPETYTPGTITIRYKENYYDYSLNTYDHVGRLTSSKQPLNHLESTYEYNALGQLLSTTSPDEGTANFVYRSDGQIRFSQNSKQAAVNEYSYTNYDSLGRPIESGVVIAAFSLTMNGDMANNFSGSRTEQNFTQYDALAPNELANLSGLNAAYHNPTFLASNVAKTHNDQNTTYYSYDIYGRVQWIVQNIEDLGVKTIDYHYDRISGQVTSVSYQRYDNSELFIHRYTYDPVDYSLIEVATSTSVPSFTTHATYEYYETGALKRTELAGGLQGIDYVYNLAGQLKAINHPSLTASNDPGGDANDLFGMMIDYHAFDYTRPRTNIKSANYGSDVYNGTIKGIRWNTENASVGFENTFAYTYNRNNWLTQANYGVFRPDYTSLPPIYEDPVNDNHLTSTTIVSSGRNLNLLANISITLLPGFHAQSGSSFSARIVNQDQNNNAGNFIPNSNADYKVNNITYDANGNIQSLNRNKNTQDGSNRMDELTYAYKTDQPNQLKRVDDAVLIATNADDIKDQTTVDNYIYNSIGQLIENKEEKVKYTYNASGLVTEVQKNETPRVRFYYNDRGHRIKKESFHPSGTTTTYYVRDAAGSVMSIYTGGSSYQSINPGAPPEPVPFLTIQKELPIYGSSRLGVHYRQSGTDAYQLTDHLGNVRAVIMKNGENAVSLTAKTDYYPFGMPMPNRNIEGNYRYRFQGQEKDSETGKEAFELRLWDGRIGRWLTVDPAGEFFSPYLGMGNNPISNIDPDGGCVDCDQNAANGSKYTDVAGANWTKGADGWGRSDGYSIDLGSLHNVRMDGYFGQTQFWMKPGEKADTYKSRLRDAQQRLHDLNWFTLESIVTATSVASGALSFGAPSLKPKQPNLQSAATNSINKANPFSLKGTQPITRSKKEFQNLVNQIKSEGIKTPVQVSTKDGVRYIVNGHHRTYIAKRLGLKNIPIKEVPFKPEHAIIQQGKNPGYLNYIKY